jgi:hypothetical protein
MPVLVHRDLAGAWTEGLAAIGRRELLVEVDHPSLVDAAAEFLRSTATALGSERIDVQAGAPIAFGSSTVRFTGVDPSGPLVASELSGLDGRFTPGVSRAARVWKLQQEVCRRQGAEFEPPPPHTLVAVSDSVLEPDAIIHGSRHPPSAPGMSGWFLLGPGDEGGRLRYERVVEVIGKLPGVGAYLALPNGHAFRTGRGVELSIVWDPEIAALVR